MREETPVPERAIAAACRRCENGMDAWQPATPAFAGDPVHALFLHDPCIANAYYKGRGGDPGTLDYIYRYRGAPPDATPPGRDVIQITTDRPIACAVRARSRYLGDRIECGQLRELDALEPPAGGGRLYGLDDDLETIDRVTRLHAGTVTAGRTNVRQILARAEAIPQADRIYAAGLFDCLDDRTAARLIRQLRTRLLPRGSLIVTNLTRRSEEIADMEAITDWWMVYRDEADLRRLVRGDAPAVHTRSVMDGRVACLELQA